MIRIGFQFNFSVAVRYSAIKLCFTQFLSITFRFQLRSVQCFSQVSYIKRVIRVKKKFGCWLKAEYSVTYATNCSLSVINTLGVDI